MAETKNIEGDDDKSKLFGKEKKKAKSVLLNCGLTIADKALVYYREATLYKKLLCSKD